MKMARQDHPLTSNNSFINYDDRFQRMLFPSVEQTIPKMHNNLATDDISGAVPGSMSAKLKQIRGRDYMDIKDIPGVNPNPNFIMYKSKHKDYKLDISDIIEKSKQKKINNKPVQFSVNPLDPQYVRMTESRRHVQVYGDIDGGKPKSFIAPRTRRVTNMVADIIGAKTKPPLYSPLKEPRFSQPRQIASQSTRTNPITGEEYAIQTDIRKPISFLKENNADKSRRLARILENFKKRDEMRSRSNAKLSINQNVSYQPNLNGFPSPDVGLPNSKRLISLNTKDSPQLYTSKDVKEAELPSFSKRKIGHQDSSFRAYEDLASDNRRHPSRRSRVDHADSEKTSHTFETRGLLEKAKNGKK